MNAKNKTVTMYETNPTIAGLNQVTGFNPLHCLRRAKSSTDGGEVLKLDLGYKKLWFRLAYPTGRMKLIRHEITAQHAIFEAKIYLDRNDAEPVANFIAQCFANDAPGGLYIQAAQHEAMDTVLNDAGFGLQFTDVCDAAGERAYGSEIPLADTGNLSASGPATTGTTYPADSATAPTATDVPGQQTGPTQTAGQATGTTADTGPATTAASTAPIEDEPTELPIPPTQASGTAKESNAAAVNQGALTDTANQDVPTATANQDVSAGTANQGNVSTATNQDIATVTANQGSTTDTASQADAATTTDQGSATTMANQGVVATTASQGMATDMANQDNVADMTSQGMATATANQNIVTTTANLATVTDTTNQGVATATANPANTTATADQGVAAANQGTAPDTASQGATANQGNVQGNIIPMGTPRYQNTAPLNELLAAMTYEEACNVIVDTGTCKGLTIKTVSERRPASLKWFTNGYGGDNNVLRAAAQIMLDSMSTQKAG